MSALREKLLAKAREKRPLLPVQAFGEDLFVRRMSGRERDAYETSLVEVRGNKRSVNLTNLRARLAVLCLVDADGKRIFTDADADELGHGDCTELNKVYEAAKDWNGLDRVEDAEKNSEPTRSDDSVSG